MYPDGQSLTWEFNLLLFCFGLSPLYTCAYTATGDPARQPGIPQLQYWHGPVRQWKARFNLTEDAPAPPFFPSSCIICLWLFWLYIFTQLKYGFCFNCCICTVSHAKNRIKHAVAYLYVRNYPRKYCWIVHYRVIGDKEERHMSSYLTSTVCLATHYYLVFFYYFAQI